MHRICAFFIAVLVMLSCLPSLGQAVHDAQALSVWQPGIFYQSGSIVTFGRAQFQCVYPHTAIAGWEPVKVPALWLKTSAAAVPEQSPTTPGPGTRRIFAPYIHVSETNNDLPAIQAVSGIKFFTLAFIVSDGGCAPAWQGQSPLLLARENVLAARIERVRKSGGDAIISFGGYVGKELAMACPDAAALAAAYQRVVDKYHVRSLDFDVEASAANDPASIELRSAALARLARANPGLEISFTVPVLANGMPQTALDLLKSAHEHQVPVSVVNLMTMDYGQPVPAGNMGPLAIVAVENAIPQLNGLGLSAGIGITPMIGMNDAPGETFTPGDARTLLQYVRSNQAIRRLSMWSVGRDRGGCTGTVSPTCSGIAQSEWEFTSVFKQF
jgi:hypothetical protein